MCHARITGIPTLPMVNARSGPALSYSIVEQIRIGTADLPVLDVTTDENNVSFDGKVYQWIQIEMPGGESGWVRDDLIEIAGACEAFGYNTTDEYRLAFAYSRGIAPNLGSPPEMTSEAREQVLRGLSGEICIAMIRGLPERDTVNVREAPSTTSDILFEAPKGRRHLFVIDIDEDLEGNTTDGKIHQWFNLAFQDGRTGWVRDDLVTIRGGCGSIGYEELEEGTLAFDLERLTAETEETGAIGDCVGEVTSSIPAAMRSGPGLDHDVIITIVPHTELEILEMQPDDDGQPFNWMRVNPFADVEGWMREDLFRYSGDCEAFGIRERVGNLFPPPMRQYQWVRGFTGISGHWGWDMANAGAPVFSGPVEGVVVRQHPCTRCTPDRPSWLQHGIPLGDRNALSDPGWGWGFGNHVIIRYLHDDLPAHTRDELASRGLEGAHIFAVYAHLDDDMNIAMGQELKPTTQIGICGNTGQSTGPHLHLEIRAGFDPNNTGPWLQLALLDPGILFSR